MYVCPFIYYTYAMLVKIRPTPKNQTTLVNIMLISVDHKSASDSRWLHACLFTKNLCERARMRSLDCGSHANARHALNAPNPISPHNTHNSHKKYAHILRLIKRAGATDLQKPKTPSTPLLALCLQNKQKPRT